MAIAEVLQQQGEQLFSKRAGLMDLWQVMAENFYPERADFTNIRNIGAELAIDVLTSYPLLARRDLGNAFGAMLRPSSKDWFAMTVVGTEETDLESKQWLEKTSKFMKRAMYHRASQFTRATKEGDHDFAAFGQTVLSVEMNALRNGFLYRCWHLRDVAWAENAEGKIDTIHRRWKPTNRQLIGLFPRTVHPSVVDAAKKNPYDELEVEHAVMPAEVYAGMEGGKKVIQPYVSVFIDKKNKHVLEEIGSWTPYYVIPRWQTVSGSQYAHSPATVAALPDARLIQRVTQTLMEAGEKAVTPPLLATKDAIRGDISVFAGGITWVDSEYDERLGSVLRPIEQDMRGLTFGMEMGQDIRTQIADAFYLSKLNLPPTTGREMTAYEVGQRIQEFIRNTLPLFEPLENDYNGQLCEATFELMMRNTPELRRSIPAGIQGAEVQFVFESPLREAVEKVKVGQFTEAQQILATAMQLDPSVGYIIDGGKATRDVLGVTVPAEWLRGVDEVRHLQAQAAEQQEAQQMLGAMQQGADVAKTLAETGMGAVKQ